MVVLSELFQFDPQFPDTTQSKAQAVEQLCGTKAFYWPMRSIAQDIMASARFDNTQHGPKPLSYVSEWHPGASHDLGDLKATLEAQLETELANRTFRNRSERRSAEAKARKVKFDVLSPAIIEAVASRYKLDRKDVARAIVPTLQGKTSSAEGSRRMFSAIARPTAFARAYFSDINDDQEFPTWISSVGDVVQRSLVEMRRKLDLLDPREVRDQSPGLIDITSRYLILELVRQARETLPEFSQDSNYEQIFSDANSLIKIPTLGLFFEAYKILVEQAIGVHGDGHEPERGAFGDLFHLLYLPHAELWRCDRRFGHIVAKVCGDYRNRVVTRLADLPRRIAAAL